MSTFIVTMNNPSHLARVRVLRSHQCVVRAVLRQGSCFKNGTENSAIITQPPTPTQIASCNAYIIQLFALC
jgi:hypothetical protein